MHEPPPERAEQLRTERRLAAEMIDMHLRRLLLDWPPSLGFEPRINRYAEFHRRLLHAGEHDNDFVLGGEVLDLVARELLAGFFNQIRMPHGIGEFLDRLAGGALRQRRPSDPRPGLPLFHFARMNRIPMLALNIDAELTRRIADKGWDGVPEGEREGVGRPAAAVSAYEDFLFEIHSQHAQMRQHGKDQGKPARGDAAFRNFVDSQLAWDRAMAEALLAGRARHAAADGSLPFAVGIMGSGHVRHGHGVAHQLAALGEPSIGQLMPVEAATPCVELPAGLADAVFAVPALRQPPPPPPRLGVGLDDTDGGIRIAELTPGSLAERSGLRRGDLITEAAGAPVRRSAQLIGLIRRQPAGTWLPLQVMREGKAVEVVVRFPREAR